MVVYRHARPAVPQGERPHRVGASLVELERHEPARLEQRPGAREQSPRRREPVHAAHERLTRLEQPHGRIETRVFLLRQVWWVRDDGPVALTGERREQVALANLDRYRRL